ncbi:MAG: hypothetical protein UX57_C0008G0013 [Candidatus Uhrbacteria bacterium GW2011_GWE2_46_68]|uniref:Uncharacterized protein n=2 Tax=Candidatus Uhriibacteriota TaxID=1752732 RepID=A0A0G1Q767_9BACT|nr:MAG: hypothetical protein UX45_C0014G0023 [Candidatus Uhrbacteria bacterium GW2011_GWF2_46_218]KKU40901.1 MAG: hypothetical protein UX57_C0008G0013 [Candidatus Uhrbacteria bacterium GW2011_GWE2_46_68]
MKNKSQPLLLIGFILFLLTLAFCAEKAHGACESQATVEEIISLVREGEKAFEDMEQASLLSARDRALSALRCLNAPLTPADVIHVHWLMALSYFTTDRSRVGAILLAIQRLDATRQIGESFAPSQEHPLAKLYAQARFLPDGEFEPVYPPQDGWALVNGVRGADRPLTQPAVVQIFDAQGTVMETRYIEPGETMPIWGPKPLDIPYVRMSPRPWGISAGASGVAAIGCYAVALATKHQIMDMENPVPDDSVPALRTRANLFGGFAVGLGVVSVGLGAASTFLAVKPANEGGGP